MKKLYVIGLVVIGLGSLSYTMDHTDVDFELTSNKSSISSNKLLGFEKNEHSVSSHELKPYQGEFDENDVYCPAFTLVDYCGHDSQNQSSTGEFEFDANQGMLHQPLAFVTNDTEDGPIGYFQTAPSAEFRERCLHVEFAGLDSQAGSDSDSFPSEDLATDGTNGDQTTDDDIDSNCAVDGRPAVVNPLQPSHRLGEDEPSSKSEKNSYWQRFKGCCAF